MRVLNHVRTNEFSFLNHTSNAIFTEREIDKFKKYDENEPCYQKA
jgi:hypothetical protein